MKWVLRRLMQSAKDHPRLARAGFVLPTVTMVTLVVVLLTTAIMLRSLDRAKNASNYRVNEAVLNAAAPALDRTRAKIERLFSRDETELEGNTPSATNIANVLAEPRYGFGDETQLKLVFDVDGGGSITADETVTSAWKVPADTDNNGKFDSFTLYGIYFRDPASGQERTPIHARGLPMDEGKLEGCLVTPGSEPGWFNSSGVSKKAFFTYVATVPITDTTGLNSNYEEYTGNRGFAALEMQRDEVRQSLDNNAVWFDDDIQLGNVQDFYLNGRVHTNSNLLVESTNPSGGIVNDGVRFRQVSSPYSCYYEPENAQMVVAGNVAPGDIDRTSDKGGVRVDLFKGKKTPPANVYINGTNKTTTVGGGQTVAYNTSAYDQRIQVMVQGAINLFGGNAVAEAATAPLASYAAGSTTRFPTEVISEFDDKYDSSSPDPNLLRKVLETYFEERTRRVPYAEVSRASTATGSLNVGGTAQTASTVFGSSNPIQPPLEWMLIEDPTTPGTVANYTNLPFKFDNSNNTMDLDAINPEDIGTDKVEELIGDRILFGNNLPYTPYFNGSFVEHTETQDVKDGLTNIVWNEDDDSAGTENRYRQSRVEILDDLGDTSRGGFWEAAAAKTPKIATEYEELAGGLRVVTGAGIYVDGTAVGSTGTGVRGTDSFLPDPVDVYDQDSVVGIDRNSDTIIDNADLIAYLQTINSDIPSSAIVVWPDTMPMYQWLANGTGDTNSNGVRDVGEGVKGDLQMRATVVYHYKSSEGKDQTPIACISSYYNNTDDWTADNANGISDNGVNYPVPARATTDARLAQQARMVFPDGRWANEPLRKALFLADGTTAKPSVDRTLADNAAIDAALCTLSIIDGATATSGSVPDGAITEQAFLDGRQVKTLHKNAAVVDETLIGDIDELDHLKIAELGSLTTEYDLPIEQRQPLEIRVTQLDMDQIRNNSVSGETLLPNSGIIYASRDDALPDISSGNSPSSASDFQLDPTRRPNGIRLINGSNLTRNNSNEYDPDKKGLILASDLPVYIKGDFNLHALHPGGAALEEFQTALTSDNFYTRGDGGAPTYDRDPRFACRQNQPNCSGNGDQWRPTRIFSDAVTLLSDDFKDGFRRDGDYDLNNNIGNLAVEARLANGFWWNDFATSRGYWNATTNPNTSPDATNQTSYLTNGTTSVQRRVNFPEYIMEICRQLPVSECGASDWVIGYDINGDGDLQDTLGGVKEADITSAQLGQILAKPTPNGAGKTAGGDSKLSDSEVNWSTQYTTSTNNKNPLERLGAGTTARPALVAEDRHYPRRVAFARNSSAELVTTGGDYQPLGVGCPLDSSGSSFANNGCIYGGRAAGTNYGNLANNALWFVNTEDEDNPSALPGSANNVFRDKSYNESDRPLYYQPPADLDGDSSPDPTGQPLLVPVLNQHSPNGSPSGTIFDGYIDEYWQQHVSSDTTYNAVFVMGDSPARPALGNNEAETGGGLHNFPRFLEAWEETRDTSTRKTAKINGSFIQFKKSIFASAPFEAIDDYTRDVSLFDDGNASNLTYMRGFAPGGEPYGYRGGAQLRRASHYRRPTRTWGYDVGLLSQTPDLFSQRFSRPDPVPPNEFYREVNRDDPWVQTLLCAAEGSGSSYDYAVPQGERPSNCPALSKYND